MDLARITPGRTFPTPESVEEVSDPKGAEHIQDVFLKNVALAQVLIARKKLSSLPRSRQGTTCVWISSDIPIVIKATPGYERVKNGCDARRICEEKKLDCVVVPRSITYDKFMIAQRLPIVGNTKYQMGLYLTEHSQFDTAVAQFAQFLMAAHIGDISGNTRHKYKTLADTPMGRYDNVSLYIENGKGKIGLVDLEGFSVCQPVTESFRPFDGQGVCKTLVTLFPRHLDTIVAAVREVNPNLKLPEEATGASISSEKTCMRGLRETAEKTLKRMDIVYGAHHRFAQQRGISATDPYKTWDVSEVNLRSIAEDLALFLRKDSEQGVYVGSLGDRPEEALDNFKKIVPKFMRELKSFLVEKMKANPLFQHPQTLAEVLCARTIWYEGNALPGEKVSDELTMISLQKWEKNAFARFILRQLLKILVARGELAYHHEFQDGKYYLHV